MLIKLLATILIFTSLIKADSTSDLIKETREKISQINISFYENRLPDKLFVSELDKLFVELKDKNIYADSVVDKKDYKLKSSQLIKSFKAFEKFYNNKPEVDTLKKVFHAVNNEFNSVFGKYFLDELKNFPKKKIIIFSTSMSCECTLEMCYRQECEVQKLLKENPDSFDYAVVDSYSNYDLQNEYEVGFIPAVILVDSTNKEIKRFVRVEKLYDKLVSILNVKE